jgi:P2-related tail formation protein
MTDFLTHLFASVPPQAWTVLLAALAVSGIQAAIVGAIENSINTNLSARTNQAINGALAALAELLNALVSYGQTNPTAFGTYTLTIVAVSQFVYRYITQPLLALLADAKAHRTANQARISAALGAEPTNSDHLDALIASEPVTPVVPASIEI